MSSLSLATILCTVLLATPFASSFVVNGRSLSLYYGLSSTLFSTLEDTAKVELTENKISISKPEIHITVPGFKLGWQDDDGNWFDEDGPRNGPPLNYWRQASDQRVYDEVMDTVDAVLTECDMDSKVSNLERKNSARKPSLSRKILGQWAPLLLSNKRIARNCKPVDYVDSCEIEIPFTIDISRSNGRKLAPKNHYGVFDKKLEHGEELTISTIGSDTSISAKVIASEMNGQVELGILDQDVQLKFGGITCIEDYVMIQRSPEGLIDFFLRVDNSYLGRSDEN